MPDVSPPLLLLALTAALALWHLSRRVRRGLAHRHERQLHVSRDTIARLRRAEDASR